MPESDRVAVLIDCDNISWQLAKSVIAEAAKHGTLSVKRAYGDWSSDYLRNWKPELPRHAIQPIQQPSYTAGKNSTDAALIIDAMDLLYAGNVDIFCIVSSDSDFTRLAMRIRESGRRVYGIGAQKTPQSFRNACDRFTFTEVLTGQSLTAVAEEHPPRRTKGETAAKTGATAALPDAPGDAPADWEPPTVPELAELIVPAIRECAQADGWAYLSSVGAYVVKQRAVVRLAQLRVRPAGPVGRRAPLRRGEGRSGPERLSPPVGSPAAGRARVADRTATEQPRPRGS
jgi:hypothetical protein